MLLKPESTAASPRRSAALLGTLYLLICLVYLWISTILAAESSVSVEELRRTELIKGTLFVGFSAILLTGILWKGLAALSRREANLKSLEKAALVSDRKALLGVLSASIAHDMNNILSAMDGVLVLLQKCSNDSPEQARLRTVLTRSTQELTRLADRLARLGRGTTEPQFETFCPFTEADRLVRLARGHPDLRDIDFHWENPRESLDFSLDRTSFNQMVLNLILNAAEAAGKGGSVRLEILTSEGDLLVRVHDSGPGIPEEQRESIFTAFHTTKEDGSGLGLLSVQNCAMLHKGSVAVSRSDLGGALFSVRLQSRSTLPQEQNSAR